MAKAGIPRPWGDDTLSYPEQADFLGHGSTQSLSVARHRGTYRYPVYKIGKYLLARKSEIIKSLEKHNRVA